MSTSWVVAVTGSEFLPVARFLLSPASRTSYAFLILFTSIFVSVGIDVNLQQEEAEFNISVCRRDKGGGILPFALT